MYYLIILNFFFKKLILLTRPTLLKLLS